MANVDAYILIGGRSSRLGQDKSRAVLGGETLLRRTADTVRAVDGIARITAVAANEAQFAIDAVMSDISFIFDLHQGRGPLGGIHAALADTKAPWVFVLACDYPFVSSDLIAMLRRKVSDDFGCVVPQQPDGRFQPLCAFYRTKTAMPIITEVIERPRVPPPMHEIVEFLDPLIVTPDEYAHLPNADSQFTNINTPEDLLSAQERLSRDDY